MKRLNLEKIFASSQDVIEFDEKLSSQGEFMETGLDETDYDMVLEIPRDNDDYRYFLATQNSQTSSHVAVFRVEKDY